MHKFENIPYVDNFFFWPVVVLIGIVLIILSFRFLIRVALFLLALLAIWYSLSYVGLLPPPAQFFKKQEKKKVETAMMATFVSESKAEKGRPYG